MKELRRILVGLDLGPRGRELTRGSRLAMDHAMLLAAHSGARVTLIHSDITDEYFDVSEDGFVLVHQGVNEEGQAALEEAASGFRQEGIKTELHVVQERIGRAIVGHVEKESTDLVLLGKRTESDSDYRRFGSVSRRMVHECPCPVWVVKPDEEPGLKSILAACELDAVGNRVLKAAMGLAEQFKAELHVLHTCQENITTQMADEREELEKATIAQAKAALKERIAEIEGEVDSVHYHVGFGSPTSTILKAEAKLDPDLVVLGTASRGGLSGWLLGNTAERLLDRLDSSLLAIKPLNRAAKPAQ